MAIAFDAAATPKFSAANVSNLTTAAFTIAGANRVLIVAVLSGAGTPLAPNAVKWGGSGGTSLTQIGSTVDINANCKLSLWQLVAPATGSNTVYVSWASAQDETAIVAASYTGVDQSTPVRTPVSATGTDEFTAVTVTSVAADYVVDGVGFIDSNGAAMTMVVDAGQTSHGEVEGANLSYEGLGTSHEVAAGTSTTMNWTLSQNGAAWGQIAVALVPSTGGAASSILRQMMMHTV